MQQLNESENTRLGIASGLIEVTCMQSTNYLKNAKQQGLPFTLDPRKLYRCGAPAKHCPFAPFRWNTERYNACLLLRRGYLPNCANMGLATGFQFFVNGAVKKANTGNSTRQLKPVEQVGAGFWLAPQWLHRCQN